MRAAVFTQGQTPAPCTAAGPPATTCFCLAQTNGIAKRRVDEVLGLVT